MSESVVTNTELARALLPRAELIAVLRTSLYPGAKPESIEMVIGYCIALGLDPFDKPVHIVPMKVKTGVNDQSDDVYEMIDVIMPGIGLYRTKAARTQQHGGTSEPEFGPVLEFEFIEEMWEGFGQSRKKVKRSTTIKYPEWCRVTVYRYIGGREIKYTAIEYWMENYAVVGYNGAPNKMWRRRVYGMLAKCTEAQALRKAFPDAVGAQATVDEIGETYDHDEQQKPAREPVAMPQRRAALSDMHTETVKQELRDGSWNDHASTVLENTVKREALINGVSKERVGAVTPHGEVIEQINEKQNAKAHVVSTIEIREATNAVELKQAVMQEFKESKGEHLPNRATQGEKAFVLRKLAEIDLDVEDAMKNAGVNGTFDDLTPDGFIALRDVATTVRKARDQ